MEQGKLPITCRYRGNVRTPSWGIDLPYWFYESLKTIDDKLWVIFHPYKVMYDDIMNQYEGSLDDPRFIIGEQYGEEVWGWIVTEGDGTPKIENKWHLWRLCDPYGWCHITPILSGDSNYLQFTLNRLHLQATIQAKYGDLAYNKHLREQETEQQRKEQEDADDLFNAVQDENKWLMREAMDNFSRGHTAPTNPTKESIISYPNQKNRTKTVRPLTDIDKESGLVLPDSWKK